MVIDLTSQAMAPALHPPDLACAKQPAKVPVSTKPLAASPEVAGFPITSLSEGTPDAIIWNRAVWGQVLEDCVSKPWQVVYSVVPSVHSDISSDHVRNWKAN